MPLRVRKEVWLGLRRVRAHPPLIFKNKFENKGQGYLCSKTKTWDNKKDNIFIKARLKKTDYQTNIYKYRVVANITEYHIVSKIFFLRIIITKFMMIKQLFHVKM